MSNNHPFAQYLDKNRFNPSIARLPERDPHIIIVIPCYKEPALIQSLQSLYCCRRPERFTEVIVVINHPDDAAEEAQLQNEKSLLDAQAWIKSHHNDTFHFHVIYLPDVPGKFAGVGYARKTGMDEAVYRFFKSGVNDGVIVGFDADSICDENYLEEIEHAFFNGKNINGASVYYEHPVDGNEYDAGVYEGAVLYELHLRYLNQALRYAGFPYACHTVGSAFAVRAAAYVKQGGMNKRKAGEDFHFLQKIIPLGNYTEINETRVIPSPRESDRVSFGTGASIRHWMADGESSLYTYPLEPFEDLKQLFASVPCFHKMSPEAIEQQCASFSPFLKIYLQQNDYIRHIVQASENSASSGAFSKRFFSWFDGLKTVQYLNDGCRQVYRKLPASEAAAALLQKMGYETGFPPGELLEIYRTIERGRATGVSNHHLSLR